LENINRLDKVASDIFLNIVKLKQFPPFIRYSNKIIIKLEYNNKY